MSKISGLTDINQGGTIEALQKALDQTYRHFMEMAKADWERLFAGSDPGNESARVRISEEEIAEELAGTPRLILPRSIEK